MNKQDQNCRNCFFGEENKEAGKGMGMCKRYPPIPQMIPIPQKPQQPIQMNNKLFAIPQQQPVQTFMVFPAIPLSEWCGEWKEGEQCE